MLRMFPGSMLASTLPWIKLERPIYKRLELMAPNCPYRKLYGSHMLQTMPHNLELAPTEPMSGRMILLL